jgi:hypothetical protein
VIVGASGSGKSTLARAAFGEQLLHRPLWPAHQAIIDCLGDHPIKRITRMLTAVGFSSPRSWLKPYEVLSTGEKFRCDLARSILRAQQSPPALPAPSSPVETWGRLCVFDEYSSVVDRTVARISSAALAKAIRGADDPIRFIAITCHYDVIRWLQPDWILDLSGPSLSRGRVRPVRQAQGGDPHRNLVRPVRQAQGGDPHRNLVRPLRQAQGGDPHRRRVRPIRQARVGEPHHRRLHLKRPPIPLRITRVDRALWETFKPHHYLSGSLHKSAQCFAAFIDHRPAAFTAVLPFPHPIRPGWREHRTVCLPDFQGVGIGSAMSDFIASLYVATKKPYFSTTSHPAMIHHRMNSPLWKLIRKAGMCSRSGPGSSASSGMSRTNSRGRNTAGFEYVGAARTADASNFGIITPPRTICSSAWSSAPNAERNTNPYMK